MTGLYGLSSYANMFRTSSSYSNMLGSGSPSGSSFYSNLGEYSSIRNGAYRELVKSYYKKMNSTGIVALSTYKAVSNFVTQYNDTVDALSKASGTVVKNVGNHMQNMTNIMSKGLSKVGITVGTDGKLTVDEQKFKAADMSKVKALFNGSSSYAGVVSSAAGRVASQAGNQISQLGGGLYGSNGYYNSYYSGSLYNGYF